MAQIPQEVLDLIIKQVHLSDDDSTVETLRNIRLTNEACSNTATALLFSCTSVSASDDKALPPFQALSRSRIAPLVRSITIYVDRQYQEVIRSLTARIAINELVVQQHTDVENAMSSFTNLSNLCFTWILPFRNPPQHFVRVTDNRHAPQWIITFWIRLLTRVVYPKLVRLELDEYLMRAQLERELGYVNPDPNVRVRPMTILQHNISGLRELKMSNWHPTTTVRNPPFDNTMLCVSAGVLDHFELRNVPNNWDAGHPGLLNGCQTKHFTLANCEVGWGVFADFLQIGWQRGGWKQLRSLTLTYVALVSGSWVTLFQGIPTACPNLIDFEAKSVVNYQFAPAQFNNCKRECCLPEEFKNGWMYVEDVAALIVFLRVIGRRRRDAGLLDDHLEAYAKHLEGVKTWRFNVGHEL